MKIGIDIRPMTAAGLGRGLATYTANLVQHLLTIDQDDHFCLFLAKDQEIKDFLERLPSTSHITVKRLRRPTRNIFLWDQLLWYALLKKERIDLFHSPMYGVPLFCPCKKVLTLHDITPLLFPEFFPKLRHQAVFRFNYFTAKYADRIITSSQNSKYDIARYLNIPEKNISVIFDGVAEQYQILPDKRKLDQLKKRYQIPGNYLLYVGGFDNNKNLEVLVYAFHLLLQKKNREDNISLVFVGKLTPDAISLRKCVKSYGIEKHVVFTDFVPEKELISFYNGAEMFVFPSLYEGFGLPPLEAMACGVPVITSNTSSLPEIIGDAGIQVDPHSADELSQHMLDVLTNPRLRETLRRKGMERARLFSWEDTARQTLEVYKDVLDS